MAKHWRYEDDSFLVDFYDAIGDYIGEHDLSRPKGAATRRVAHLKKTGAWDALVRMKQAEAKAGVASMLAELEYARALGFEVQPGRATAKDFANVAHVADIYDGDYPWRRDPFGEAEEQDAWSSSDLGDLIREAVSNHNDVDGVAWQLVACEVAKAIKVMLIDVRPSTGLPAEMEARRPA